MKLAKCETKFFICSSANARPIDGNHFGVRSQTESTEAHGKLQNANDLFIILWVSVARAWTQVEEVPFD